MLPLASWLMQGRSRTLGFVLVALATSPLLWPNSILAAAAISLVWLRIGVRDGVLVWLWALLPTITLAFYQQGFMPLLLVCSTVITSWVLRRTVSWPFTLMSISACGALTAICLEYFAVDSLTVYKEAFDRALGEFRQQLAQPELQAILPDSVETVFVAGLFGTLLVVGTFVSVALARSWQSKLYNPGGFQKEFHQLRLGKLTVILMILLTGLLFGLGEQYLTWVWIVLFPVLIAGVALFHAFALQKKLALHWYVIFYIVLVFWDPVKVFLAGLAIADSFMNLREKLPDSKTD